MPSINPTINSVVSTLLGRPDSLVGGSNQRGGLSREAQGAPGAVRVPDSGDIRQRGGELAKLSARLLPAEQSAYAAQVAHEGLQSIDELIGELRRLVDDAESFATKTGRDVALFQRQIDSVSRSIQTVADQTSFAGTKLLTGGSAAFGLSGVQPPDEGGAIRGATVTFADPRLESYGFRSLPFPPDGVQNLDVEVTQSAQLGGFFLSFGNDNLQLGGAGASDGFNDQFVIEVGGVAGAQQIAFASGTTLNNIVAAINSFTGATGVTAQVSGTGIVLNSTEYGADRFVSVRIHDDGNAGTFGNIGVYNLLDDQADTAATESLRTFSNGQISSGVTDFGQDIAGSIGGYPTTGEGRRLTLDWLNFDLYVELTEEGAQQIESFKGLTVERLSRPGSGGLGGILGGRGLESAATDRGVARELIDSAQAEVRERIASLEAFAERLRTELSGALASAEGVVGLDLDAESARATAAKAVQSVLHDDPRALVEALSNFTPQRTLDLLSGAE